MKLEQAFVPTQHLPAQEVLQGVDVPRTLPFEQSRKPSAHVGATAEMVITSPASSAPADTKIPASTFASAAPTPLLNEASEPTAVTLTKDEEPDGALSALP